jgi:hypothetical protein
MRIMLVTDAWEPQVNGVVRTLKTTARELGAMGHTVEFLTPLEFRTLPCPTYPEIRLSLFPRGRVTRRIEAFDPDVLHIATEGPLGMAARRWALTHYFPFTTAYHTRFPEYVHARLKLPLSWSYDWLRGFHGASKAVMTPTQVVKDDLEANGFKNVKLWSRGVDQDIFRPQPSNRLATTPPIFLYVGRVAVEKNVEAFLDLDLPGSKWVVGTGPALESLRGKYTQTNYLGVLEREERRPTCSSSRAGRTRSAWCCWRPWPADCRSRPIQSRVRAMSSAIPTPACCMKTCARHVCARSTSSERMLSHARSCSPGARRRSSSLPTCIRRRAGRLPRWPVFRAE